MSSIVFVLFISVISMFAVGHPSYLLPRPKPFTTFPSSVIGSGMGMLSDQSINSGRVVISFSREDRAINLLEIAGWNGLMLVSSSVRSPKSAVPSYCFNFLGLTNLTTRSFNTPAVCSYSTLVYVYTSVLLLYSISL